MAAEAHALNLAPAVAVVGIAVTLVVVSARLGLGTVLGYLAAGLVVGPSGLGLFPNAEDATPISEIGVVLLLFIIGLELQPSRIRAMARDAFGLGGLQVVLTTALGLGALVMMGTPLGPALVIAFALALSSTAMALQLANERRELASAHGQKAFAVLLFQDIAVIPALVLLSLAGTHGEISLAPLALGIAGAVILLVLGRSLLGGFFRIVAATRSRELFTVGALFAVIAIAWGMAESGLSMGLGAFLAGVVLSRSEYRHELETVIDPFKGVLMGLFFLAVGMTIDLGLVEARWLAVLAGIVALLAAKFALLYGLSRVFGASNATALRVAALISQGGEFAFVILAQATATGLVGAADAGLATVVVTGSMALTPLILKGIDALGTSRPVSPESDGGLPSEHPRVIIAGFGRFGQVVARVLASQRITFTALDKDPSQVDFVRRFGNEIYFGDATRLDLLQTAHIDEATVLVIAIDDVDDSMKLAELARAEFPTVKVVARARNRFHAYRLLDLGIEHVYRETFGSSLESTYQVLRELGLTSSGASKAVRTFRQHDERIMQAAAPHHANMEKLVEIAKEGRKELQSLFAEDEKR